MHSLFAGNAAKTGPSAGTANDARDSIKTGSSKPGNSTAASKVEDSAVDASNRELRASNTRRRRLSVIPSGKVGIRILVVRADSCRLCPTKPGAASC